MNTLREDKTLKDLKGEFEEYAAEWSGEEPKGEHRAMAASDIVDTIKSLEDQIAKFDF